MDERQENTTPIPFDRVVKRLLETPPKRKPASKEKDKDKNS